MAVERLGHTDVVSRRERFASPRTPNKLFDEILDARANGRKMDPLPFMQELIDSSKLDVRTSSQATVDPDRPIVIVPNHYHNPQLGQTSTLESMKNISIVTDGAFLENAAQGHTAWFIKYLRESRIPTLGMKARRVQNAAPEVFDYIGVKVEKDRIANLPELAQAYAKAKERKSAIGYFPEQEPTTVLKRPHENFMTFIKFTTQSLYDKPVQFIPTSVRFNAKEAEVHFGQVINIGRGLSEKDIKEVANLTMQRIAYALHPSMRGPYA